MCVYICVQACVCVYMSVWFIATWRTLAHFCKSISAPEGNLHGTIYEAEFTISVQLLGPTEKTAADMNLLEQRHLVASLRVAPMMCLCV